MADVTTAQGAALPSDAAAVETDRNSLLRRSRVKPRVARFFVPGKDARDRGAYSDPPVSQHTMADPAAWARAIIDSSSYMVLGTADEAGLPWATPVWFAHVGYGEFIWVSRTDVRHSLNIALRPQISIVIFDSSVPIGTGQGV